MKNTIPLHAICAALLCVSSTSSFAQTSESEPSAAQANPAIVTQAQSSSANSASKIQSDREKTKDVLEDEEQEESGNNWSLGLSYGMSLGIGAFAKHKYTRRYRARYDVGLSASYTIPVINTTLSIGTGFGQYISEAGGSQTKNEFRWHDSSIALSRSIWNWSSEDNTYGFFSTASLGFALPTSRSSINTDLYTSINPSLGLSFKMGPMRFSYRIAYSHNFHRYINVVLDPADVDIIARNGGNEFLNDSAIAVDDSLLTEMSLANVFSVSYTFIPRTLSIVFAIASTDSWSYDSSASKIDHNSSHIADPGREHNQASTGRVQLNWSPLDFFACSFYLRSSQPWKTADNVTYRFPWFDLISPTNNFTRFGFNLSFNIDSMLF